MLRAALPPAAGGPQLEAAAGNEDNPAVVEHEVAASVRAALAGRRGGPDTPLA